MNIYGIDPGTLHSALVVIPAGDSKEIIYSGWRPNAVIEDYLQWEMRSCDVLALEWVVNYGRTVGEEVFRTAYACGRFSMIATHLKVKRLLETGKPDLNMHFCGTRTSKKPQTRRALIDKWGGDAETRKDGNLRGVTDHMWDALAVAVHAKETFKELI